MISTELFQDYHALHRIPELDMRLPQTLCYIRSRLEPLPCRILSPTEGAICAYFNFQKQETLAFRCELDALPVQEQTGLPFSSVHPGKMHACGHDGHTAILLETARRIGGNGNFNVLLIFQPSEETDGGAEKICQTGILEELGVRAIFALHLWPGLPKGEIFSRPGVLMNSACQVRAEFTGRSVHIANYSQGADALRACCRFYSLAQKKSWFLKFGKLTGGSAGNVVCQKAVLEGSLRGMKKKTPAQLKKLCRRGCRYTGCQGKIFISQGYPAVWNDPQLYRKIIKLIPVGNLKKYVRTGEDFSFYQKRVPGVYFLLGIGNTPPLHSPEFAFDEQVLTAGVNLFRKIYTDFYTDKN